MKIILTLLLAGWWTSGALAQEVSRDFSVKITNRRGKGVASVVVQSVPGGEVGITGNDGRYVFTGISPDGQIRLFLPGQGEVDVPVQGLDSLLVVLRSNQPTEYLNAQNRKQIDIGYGTVSSQDNTLPANELDVEALVEQYNVRNLTQLIKGRIAGVDVSADGAVTIRGMHTLTGSNEPLVVVNGIMESGTFAQVDASLNIRDVKSLTVLKDGSMYGAQGANGVILITTKK